MTRYLLTLAALAAVIAGAPTARRTVRPGHALRGGWPAFSPIRQHSAHRRWRVADRLDGYRGIARYVPASYLAWTGLWGRFLLTPPGPVNRRALLALARAGRPGRRHHLSPRATMVLLLLFRAALDRADAAIRYRVAFYCRHLEEASRERDDAIARGAAPFHPTPPGGPASPTRATRIGMCG